VLVPGNILKLIKWAIIRSFLDRLDLPYSKIIITLKRQTLQLIFFALSVTKRKELYNICPGLGGGGDVRLFRA
jgi:hypothetical protein